MKKVRLDIEERVTYRRQVEIILPERMSESQLEQVLDSAEGSADFQDDYISFLNRCGITVTGYDSSYGSPDRGEVECYMYDIIDEEGDQQ